MTIRKGQPWGEAGPLPADGVVVRSDGEARAVVEAARRAGTAVPALGLLGGDLARTLGARGDEGRLRSDDARRVSVDLGSVLADGRQHWFVAHLVARRSWWRGRVVAVMNAQYLGPWDVARRAHPGDGRLDVVDAAAALSVRDRWHARRRLPLGTHVPHPRIGISTAQAWQTTLDPHARLWLDGEAVGPVTHVSVRVEPDALTVVV